MFGDNDYDSCQSASQRVNFRLIFKFKFMKKVRVHTHKISFNFTEIIQQYWCDCLPKVNRCTKHHPTMVSANRYFHNIYGWHVTYRLSTEPNTYEMRNKKMKTTQQQQKQLQKIRFSTSVKCSHIWLVSCTENDWKSFIIDSINIAIGNNTARNSFIIYVICRHNFNARNALVNDK